jgi:hypothetical protein
MGAATTIARKSMLLSSPSISTSRTNTGAVPRGSEMNRQYFFHYAETHTSGRGARRTVAADYQPASGLHRTVPQGAFRSSPAISRPHHPPPLTLPTYPTSCPSYSPLRPILSLISPPRLSFPAPPQFAFSSPANKYIICWLPAGAPVASKRRPAGVVTYLR